MAWTQAAVQQMAQGVAGYQDTQRLATDVEEIVRELRSLAPKGGVLQTSRPIATGSFG